MVFILDYGVHTLLRKLAEQDCWGQLPLNMQCFTVMDKGNTDSCIKCMEKLQYLERYALLLLSTENMDYLKK
jgi:hypothetical protein